MDTPQILGAIAKLEKLIENQGRQIDAIFELVAGKTNRTVGSRLEGLKIEAAPQYSAEECELRGLEGLAELGGADEPSPPPPLPDRPYPRS